MGTEGRRWRAGAQRGDWEGGGERGLGGGDGAESANWLGVTGEAEVRWEAGGGGTGFRKVRAEREKRGCCER